MHSEAFRGKCIDVWIYFIFKLIIFGCSGSSLLCGFSLVAVLLIVMASLVAGPRLSGRQASVVAAPGL